MECKLHNRYIYTERQSCHARTPRVLTYELILIKIYMKIIIMNTHIFQKNKKDEIFGKVVRFKHVPNLILAFLGALNLLLKKVLEQ